MDNGLRRLERLAATGDRDAQAAMVRAMVRAGKTPAPALVTRDVMTANGHAKPQGIRNSAVKADLLAQGWVEGETLTVHVQGIDCGGWTHCGWECCGPCPACGDDYERARERDEERTLLYPPLGLSARQAQKACNRIMRLH